MTSSKEKGLHHNLGKVNLYSQANPNLDYTKDFRIQFLCDGVREYKIDALEYLADLLLAWVRSSEELYFFNEFLNMQNIIANTFNEWTERCPRLHKAKKITMQTLGANRERAAFFKKAEPGIMRHMQGLYDPQWKAQERYHAELRAKSLDKENKGNVTIVLPSLEEIKSERGTKDNT